MTTLGNSGFQSQKIYLFHPRYGYNPTVIPKKQWIRKTTLQQYLSVFDVVTKQIVNKSRIKSLFQQSGSTLLKCCLSSSLGLLKLKLDAQNCLPISELFWLSIVDMSQTVSLSESVLITENVLYFCLLYLGFKPGLFNARFYTQLIIY